MPRIYALSRLTAEPTIRLAFLRCAKGFVAFASSIVTPVSKAVIVVRTFVKGQTTIGAACTSSISAREPQINPSFQTLRKALVYLRGFIVHSRTVSLISDTETILALEWQGLRALKAITFLGQDHLVVWVAIVCTLCHVIQIHGACLLHCLRARDPRTVAPWAPNILFPVRCCACRIKAEVGLSSGRAL